MTVKVGGKPGPQKTFYKGFDIRRVLVGLGVSGVLDRIACPPFLLSVTAVSKSATVAESLLKERAWSRRCHPEILLQGLAGAGEGRRGQSPKVLCA